MSCVKTRQCCGPAFVHSGIGSLMGKVRVSKFRSTVTPSIAERASAVTRNSEVRRWHQFASCAALFPFSSMAANAADAVGKVTELVQMVPKDASTATAAAGSKFVAKAAAAATAAATGPADVSATTTAGPPAWIEQATNVLSSTVLFLIVYVTVGAVVITYINWKLDNNEKRSIAEIKARIEQFGGEAKVDPMDFIFATEKPVDKTKRWKMKPFAFVDTLARTMDTKPVVIGGSVAKAASSSAAKQQGYPSSGSGNAAAADALDDTLNRTGRRIAAKERRRQEKEDARQAELRANRDKNEKGDGKE